VTYNVTTRIKAVSINALIGLLVTVICSPNLEGDGQGMVARAVVYDLEDTRLRATELLTVSRISLCSTEDVGRVGEDLVGHWSNYNAQLSSAVIEVFDCLTAVRWQLCQATASHLAAVKYMQCQT
jgi:hypothetical protein